MADGENAALDRRSLGTHVSHCAGCAHFAEQLGPLVRAMRLRALDPAPERVAAILDAMGTSRPRGALAVGADRAWALVRHPRWGRAGQWAVAFLPLGIVVPSIALGVVASTHGVPAHVVTPCTAGLVGHHRPR